MVKKCFSVLIACVFVASGLNLEVEQHPNLKGGFVSSSTARRYSSDTTSLSCAELEEVNKIYDELVKEKVPLAEVIKLTKSEGIKPSCYIHFKTTFALDVTVDNSKSMITKSITDLHNALVNAKRKSLMGMTAFDFIYDASKNQLMYKAIEKFPKVFTSQENLSITNPKQSQSKLSELLERKVLYDWHKESSNFDSQFEDYKVNEDGFSWSNKLEEVKSGDERDSMGYNYGQALKILKIGVKKEGNQWKVSSDLAPDTNTFSFDENTEVFSIYLCQKMDKKMSECINLKENGPGDAFSWNFKVKDNYKVDIDIRPVRSLDKYLNLKLFKVFFNLSDVNSMRIIPTKTFSKDLVKLQKKTRGYLLIDKGTEELLVFELETYKFEKIKITNKQLTIISDNKNEIDVFQIPCEVFKSYWTSNIKFFQSEKSRLKDIDNITLEKANFKYKYYQIIIPSKNILTLTNQDENQPASIYSTVPLLPSTSSLIQSCSSKSLNLRNYFIEPVHTIYLGEEVRKYDCRVKLSRKKSFNNSSNNNEDAIFYRDIPNRCFKIGDKTDIPTYVPYPIDDLQNFEWNFNTEEKIQDNQDRSCTIYIDQNSNEKPARFLSKEFEFPELARYRIYLSIRVDEDSSNFIFSAFYFDKSKNLVEIVDIGSTSTIRSNVLPSTLFFSVVTNDKIEATTRISFVNMRVNYQSSNEIVYAISLKGISECEKGINLFFKDDNLILQCTKSNKNTRKGRIFSNNLKQQFTTGLDKVFAQALKSANILI